MNTNQIIILSICVAITLLIQILAAFIAYKITHPKIYTLNQILDEDIKNTQKLFDLKKYIEQGPMKTETINTNSISTSYEIWGNAKNTKFVILIHGISNRKERMLKYAKVWNDAGYNAVIFDGRGYNENKHLGNCTFGFKESDLLNHIKNDVSSKYTISKIGLHGESMGASTVFNWVKKYQTYGKVDFIVAESGYFSFSRPAIKGMRNNKVPKFIAMFLLFFVTRWVILLAGVNLLSVNISKKDLGKFNMPIMLISSENDKIVPYSEHVRIKQKLDDSDVEYNLFEVEEAKHVRILTNEKYQEKWIKNLKQFIKGVENE